MTGVACSTALYTMYHFVSECPEVEYCKEMRQDELKGNPLTAQRAQVHVRNSWFRAVASWRDRTVSSRQPPAGWSLPCCCCHARNAAW
jgi:hypothetical protein